MSLGRAGIVLGLECSRLARDSADWQQLIKICAHNDTLICDEDGLYDPASFNDRLLLGLKGTLAESELHFLRARMQGGLLAKARRGELKLRLPAGLAYDAAGIIMLDPDTEVRGAVQLLLDTFTATGSARAVVAAFNAASLTFPGRHLGGPHAGELYFKPLTHDHVLDVLHNPAYAGAYVYGRSKTSTGMDGHARTRLRLMADWTVFIRDHHPGYLTWSQYERNQAVLSANAASRGEDRAAGPAREGSALLQGVVICGRCGRRMTVGYHTLADRTRVPAYHCQRAGIRNALPACQAITGAGADAAISALICDSLTPLAVATALTVTAELAADARKANTVRAAHVQRAQNAADTAGRRYLAVDPANRLVADNLEADWNARLRELADARDDYARARDTDAALDEDQQARVLALAADFPALWNNPATPMRERKRLLRLLITDVTLTRDSDGAIRCQVRFTGGQHHTLTLPRPLTATEQHTTSPATVELIGQLLDDHPFDEIAAILNSRGITGGWGRAFTVPNLAALCRARGLGTHASRLLAAGMLTAGEIAADFKVTPQTIGKWHRRGLITARRTDGRGECLFHPGQHRPGPAEQTAARQARRHPAPAHQPATRGQPRRHLQHHPALDPARPAHHRRAPTTAASASTSPASPVRPVTRSPPRAARQAPATPSPAGNSPPGTASAAPLSTNGTSSDSSAPSAPTAPAGTSTTPASKPPAANRSVSPVPPAATCLRKMSDPRAILSSRRHNTPDRHTRNRIINMRCSVKPDRS